MRSISSAYLIRPRELNPAWVLLYAGTFALQLLITAPVRYGVCYAVVWVPTKIFGWEVPVYEVAMVGALGPLAISLTTLLYPWGGDWWQQRMGGRAPSEREWAPFELAFEELRRVDPELRPPRRWFVTDERELNAAAYADTLMVTRGMLEHPGFAAVLAHELGHLNTGDTRVCAAVYRILTAPRGQVEKPFKTIALFATGRLALLPMRPLWAIYWREREVYADRYAAGLGQGRTLAEFLDDHALHNDMPSPFKDFGLDSHPWTEHRIDKLATLTQREG